MKRPAWSVVVIAGIVAATGGVAGLAHATSNTRAPPTPGSAPPLRTPVDFVPTRQRARFVVTPAGART